MPDKLPTTPGSSAPALKPTTRPKPGAALAAFAAQVNAHRAAQPPRLIFAMDATGSRQPAWDMAVKLQSEMFSAVANGGLLVQLVAYMGGLPLHDGGTVVGSRDGTPTVAGGKPVDKNPARLIAGPFTSSSDVLGALMRKVVCRVGYTQLARVLRHAISTHRKTPIKAMVIVGDAAEHDGGRQGGEVEQDRTEDVLALAHQLGRAGVPVFMFQEGENKNAREAFQAIAKATKGAYAPFSEGSADQLKELLKAVATFAVSGVEGLKAIAGTDKTAVAGVLFSCLTGGGTPPTPQPNAKPPKLLDVVEDAINDPPPDIDYSVPVKGPRPKNPMEDALLATMPFLDALDQLDAGTLDEPTVDKTTAAVSKAMTMDLGTGLAAAEMEGVADELARKAQALANKGGRIGDKIQALAYQSHALATMLHAKLGE
jgi:hypothetical protein